MDEYFLHFLWKFQKFTRRPLLTESGEEVTVFHTGYSHDHAGPDFEEAKLKIGDITWNGPIEIHYRSSDWFAHNHEKDKKYNQIVLHVVWINDKSIQYDDGRQIPTLVIKDYVDENLTSSYRQYINKTDDILCSSYDISSISQLQMKDHAIAGRLDLKAAEALDIANQVADDWEEVAYRLLCKNMGFSVNKEPLLRLSEILPFKILKKHSNNIFQLEALIFGQAGFLLPTSDDYQSALFREYEFLRLKYNLKDAMHRTQWLFLRLRPANFPTVRLSQLSGFIYAYCNIFSWMIDLSIDNLKKTPKCPVSEYWQKHYDFGKTLKTGSNHFGSTSWYSLIINTSVPLLGAYSRYTDDQAMYEKAITLLSSIKAESNHITKKWQLANIKIENALDSQALIHQYRAYCLKKKCLQCNIGVNILHRT